MYRSSWCLKFYRLASLSSIIRIYCRQQAELRLRTSQEPKSLKYQRARPPNIASGKKSAVPRHSAKRENEEQLSRLETRNSRMNVIHELTFVVYVVLIHVYTWAPSWIRMASHFFLVLLFAVVARKKKTRQLWIQFAHAVLLMSSTSKQREHDTICATCTSAVAGVCIPGISYV